MQNGTLLAVIAGSIGGVLAIAAIVAAVVVTVRTPRVSPQDRAAGRELLRRLGMAGLVRTASEIRTWQVRGRDVVAARTDGRGWATDRERMSVTMRITGPAYSLVAVRLPAVLPTVNILRDGVLGDGHVSTESGRFNDERDIRTDDDRVAHAVLAPHVIELLQGLPEDLTVQIVGDHLISFRRGAPDQAETAERAESLVRVVEAIPEFVYDTS
jgi:hypothetical protein